MKVLMFGWEFPPHISGGLGTACYGLTHSLSRNNIDILFVVPRLHGDESADRTTFINASNIPLTSPNPPAQVFSSNPGATGSPLPSLAHQSSSQGSVKTIPVPSSLSPYDSPLWSGNSYGLENWNYAFDRFTANDESARAEKNVPTAKPGPRDDQTQKQKPYRFSGAYGENLMEEVHRYAAVAAEIASRYEFDVIHAHDWMTFLAGVAAKKISGKPLVVHVHATEYDRSGEHVNPTVKDLEMYGMLEADRVVAVSNWTRKIAVERYGVPGEKVEVVHNGIFPRNRKAASAQRPTFGDHLVTFLGRVTHQKGPLHFVEAARLVSKCMPGTHFVVAGAGDMLPVMIERIAQLRMSALFHFTGFLKGHDLDRVWAMSDVYVMPSVSEPFGIAPLEAIQAGVPVIISNQSGVAEVMPHAIKVDFWNTNALAASICSVLKYNSLSRTLAQNGEAEVRNVTWNKAADKLTKIYYGLAVEQDQR